MENRIIKWGLLGAGNILNRWMRGAVQVEDMEIAAISSRNIETAQKMGEKLNIPDVLTYDELLAREDIDVVYIPVPHSAHKELALRAMRAGKAVLVEKPAAVNAAEFQEMIDCAKENNVFLMEAMWTRCFPMMDTIRKIISDGKIGKVRFIQAYCSYRLPDTYTGRAFDPMTAGGGLLDVGVYNLHFVDAILGKSPVSLFGKAAIDTDDLHLQIDEQAAYMAQYDEGEIAVMASGVRTNLPAPVCIYGTNGRIEVPAIFKPTQINVIIGRETEQISIPVPQNVEGVVDEGFQYEIRHVNDCLRNGLKESPLVSWEDSLRILQQCDSLRREWNLVYPFEKSL